MDKEIIIEKLVILMRKDNLLFKSVVNYVNSAYKGCLQDNDAVAKYQSKAKK